MLDFKDLLQYARQYKKELQTLNGLRDFLERIQEFDEFDFKVLNVLCIDLDIDESSEVIASGDVWYCNNIYEYLEEYLSDCGTELPYWIRIDYERTFRDICIECQVVYTDMNSPFVIYW